MSNLEIFDFKTHGIQMSGFKNSAIENVDVGPNIIEDKLSPFYSQWDIIYLYIIQLEMTN